MENPKSQQEFIKIDDVERLMKEYKLDQVPERFMERIFTIMAAVLALIAALAWDVFIKDLFLTIFPQTAPLMVHLLYAVLLTVLAALVSVYAPDIRRYLKFKKMLKKLARKEKDTINHQ